MQININSLNNTININGLAETGIEYKARLYNFATNTWTGYTLINYPTNSISYNSNSASCNGKYKLEIIPICSGINGFSQLLVFNVPLTTSLDLSFTSTVQNQNLCSGFTYTFSVNAVNLGTNPVYQWKINNVNAGSNVA